MEVQPHLRSLTLIDIYMRMTPYKEWIDPGYFVFKLRKENNKYIWKVFCFMEIDKPEYFKDKIVIKKVFPYQANNEIPFNESDLDEL